jgi:surfeit locus 1 family protein
MAQQHYSAPNPRARYVRSAITTLVFLVFLLLFVSAGIWQLGRAGQKYDLKATFSAGSVVNTVPALVSDEDAAEYRYRRFELWGNYDPDHQILLDSIVAGGRTGYQVLTPFHTGGRTVLVNRGWVPADADRRILPTVDVSDKSRTIVARLNSLPVPGMHLGNPEFPNGPWPRRMLYPTRDEIAIALDSELLNYQLLLDAKQEDGYLRDWKAVEIGPERHYGYAFQWFAFALLALFFYVLLNFRWNRQHKETLQAEERKSNTTDD